MDVKILETVEDYAVMLLPIDGYEKLSLKDKKVLHNLWHASVAGDRIAYDQQYRYGLALRDFFLDLIEYKEHIDDNHICELILLYTKQIVIHHGNHDARSTAKFYPKFTEQELESVIKIVSKKGFHHALNQDMKKVIFDKNYDIMLTQKNPENGDIITESKNNLYSGVTLEDLKNFNDAYPLNSTIVKENGELIEKVWRAGNMKVSRGLYSMELKNVVDNLKLAKEHTDKTYAKILDSLIDYFETGDPNTFDDYNIEWLRDDPNVDAIIGFIEQYLDARGFKGFYEGVVFFRDEKTNHLIQSIVKAAQHLENNAPWSEKYKKIWDKLPVANATMQVIAVGGAGPVCFAGVNLPNAQWLREKYGSKNIYVSNITYASRKAFSDELWNEFLERKEDIVLMHDSFTTRGPIMVTLHEIVGHGSGKVNPKLVGDPRDHLLEYYSTLEELRAELCAIYHVFDKSLIKDAVVTEKDAQGAYLSYVLGYMTQLRRYDGVDMIHEDHERATSVIVRYLLDKGSCGFYTKNGKTYPKVKDYELMREQVGVLLSEVMRIKAEGDYDAGKKLVEQYGMYFDKKLRDEIVERSRKINYPNGYAYVMYHTELVHDAAGNIIDVLLKPYDSILEQAQSFRRLYG